MLDDLLRLDKLLMLDDLSGFGQHVVFFLKKKIHVKNKGQPEPT